MFVKNQIIVIVNEVKGANPMHFTVESGLEMTDIYMGEVSAMKNIDYQLIGIRVRERRHTMGYTQEQLAFESELSSTYISYIETGKRKISLEALVTIAYSLHTTADDLLLGNQAAIPNGELQNISHLLSNCTPAERKFLYEVLYALLLIIRSRDTELFPKVL